MSSKLNLLFITIFSLLFSAKSIADSNHENVANFEESHFLTPNMVMNSKEFLDSPPTDTSTLFKLDEEQYMKGLAIRNTQRGAIAKNDSDVSTSNILKSFSDAFGFELSEEKTPAIAFLIDNMKEDAGSYATKEAKNHFQRIRPYAYYKEAPCNPADVVHLNPYKSYPSGHTTIGWSVALVLSEINPDRQLEILKRGFDFGQSRVICGYHWQSDVSAGRLLAAAVVARLHANDDFNKAMLNAKKEFSQIKMLGN